MAHLCPSAAQFYIEEIWGWDEDWQRNKFDENIAKYQTRLVYVDGDRAGYVQIDIMERCTDISNLILEPDFQSKGIGKMILGTLQPKQPNHLLKLQCFAVNHRAYNFYLRCGFEAVKTDEKFIYLQRKTSTQSH